MPSSSDSTPTVSAIKRFELAGTVTNLVNVASSKISAASTSSALLISQGKVRSSSFGKVTVMISALTGSYARATGASTLGNTIPLAT